MELARRIVVCVAVGLVCLVALGRPAGSQVETPGLPPLPPLPAEVTPVLEIIGPVAATGCANAQAVFILGLLLGGGQLNTIGVNPRPTTNSVFILCGNLPFSERRYKCAPDDLVRNIADLPLKTTLGLPLPMDVGFLGQIIGTTYELQDKLPPPANTAGLADQVSTTLTCYQANAPEAGSGEPPVEEPTDTTFPEPVDDDGFASGTEFFALPVSEGLLPLLTDPSLASIPTAPLTQAPTAIVPAPVAIGAVFRFRYPGVFALPIFMVAAAMLLGRAFTRSFDRS